MDDERSTVLHEDWQVPDPDAACKELMMAEARVASELVMRCFHARTAAHVFHLRSRSFAEHKALNDFYDDIVDLVDSFAEVYQGEHGLLALDGAYAPGMNPKAMLAGLAAWIAENRDKVCPRSDTHIQNIIDEIVALINETLYKLKFLA